MFIYFFTALDTLLDTFYTFKKSIAKCLYIYLLR